MPLDLALLSSLRPQTQIHYFPAVGSTMIEASRLVHAGACHGTVVFADEQTAGIGRLGRHWVSELGVGIYCSILLRFTLPSSQLPVVNLLLGLAVAGAIARATTLACDLRWPNDVLIDERKVAGILPHLVEGCLVAGIGINVNNTKLAGNLRTPATSLKIARSGESVSREHLLAQLLNSVDEFSSLLSAEGTAAILRAFTNASSYVSNRRVIVEDNSEPVTTAGLDENGFLLVRHDNGRVARIAAGGIRPIT